MAASIRNTLNDPKERKPVLIDRIDGFESDISQAHLLPKEEGFISISDDRSIRIWLKRETGKYWPSVCHYADTVPTALFYHAGPRRLFIGLDKGNILEFAVGEDYNKITLIKCYAAHTARVTSLFYSLEHDWILSTSRDKSFTYHSTETAKRIATFKVKAFTTCIAFDTRSNVCFFGDNNGAITMIQLTDSECKYKTTMTGHCSTVTSLSWDPDKGHLFSASYDKIIILWDVGGNKGISYDLTGHKDRVTCLQFMPKSHQLVSCSEDSKIVIWDMLAKRTPNPDWVQQDECKHCKAPFFWNYKAMWEKKVVGKRQHHCRKCGAAVCDDCSNNRSNLPSLGHEFSVRICSQCINSINEDEKTPLAQFYEAKQMITSMSFDAHRKYLLTIGSDRCVKIWDMSSILTL